KRGRLSRARLTDLPSALRCPAHGDVASRGSRHVESSHDRISFKRGKQYLFDRRVCFLVIEFRLFPSFPEGQSQKTIWLNIGLQYDLIDEPRLHPQRSEEHTSELQSPCNLVCRLLLEKKKKKKHNKTN